MMWLCMLWCHLICHIAIFCEVLIYANYMRYCGLACRFEVYTEIIVSCDKFSITLRKICRYYDQRYYCWIEKSMLCRNISPCIFLDYLLYGMYVGII